MLEIWLQLACCCLIVAWSTDAAIPVNACNFLASVQTCAKELLVRFLVDCSPDFNLHVYSLFIQGELWAFACNNVLLLLVSVQCCSLPADLLLTTMNLANKATYAKVPRWECCNCSSVEVPVKPKIMLPLSAKLYASVSSRTIGWCLFSLGVIKPQPHEVC